MNSICINCGVQNTEYHGCFCSKVCANEYLKWLEGVLDGSE